MSDRSRKPFLVVGLGRFGEAVARSLDRMGHEVLGIDNDPRQVEALAPALTQTIEADATDMDVLKRLGVDDFTAAVVAIGSDMEASILTVLALSDLGLPRIWAKAVTENHGRILERTGATDIVFPEARMGERVAHIMSGRMMDYIEFDDGFAIAKMSAPAFVAGKSLEESGVRTRHDITVVGVKRPNEDFEYARPETTVDQGDLLIISGTRTQVECFVALQ